AAGSVGVSPLLNVQVALGLAGNVVLLLSPALRLVLSPAGWPEVDRDAVLQAGEAAGWLALLAAVAASLWHLRQTVAQTSVHMLCGLGLALGVLLACTAGRWEGQV